MNSFFFLSVRSSSTEHPSIGEGGLGNSGGIEPEPVSRGACSNVPIEAITSKQRRDKVTNKGPQDEEEERGYFKIFHFYLI